MKIILLSGEPNKGKTSTLNLLYDKITQNGMENIIVKRKQLGNQKNDFECVLTYKNKEIAIFSMGDYLNACIDAIIKYSNRDVLVLAYSEIFNKKLDKIIGDFSYHCVIRKTEPDEIICNKIISEL